MIIAEALLYSLVLSRRRVSSLRCCYYRRRVLICGDGDLSFAASIAHELSNEGAHLTASVLESELDHREVYLNSGRNAILIQEHGHEVRYNVDATKLKEHFASEEFDCIKFNFPHIKGKTNVLYNRELIRDFFASASMAVSQNGQIQLALMRAQAGMHSRTMKEWKQSWMPALYAAQNNLLLTKAESFQPSYNVSSYRFLDKQFHLKDPFLYTFIKSGDTVPSELQLYCHYELYFQWEHSGQESTTILQDFIDNQLKSTGWRAKVYFRRSFVDEESEGTVSSYKIFLLGERSPITREESDRIRLKFQEIMIAQRLPIIQRGVWSISNPCPASLLPCYLAYIGIQERMSETRF